MSDDLTIEERLNAQLNEANRKIGDLKKEIEHIQYEDEWKWRHLRKLSVNENLGLPVPRLEIRYSKLTEWESAADYGLVYSHFWKAELMFVPISSTKCGGRMVSDKDNLKLPFRDGVHIQHDMKQLNLRGFIVNGPHYREIEPGEKQ